MKNPLYSVRLRFPEYGDELPESLDGESDVIAERRWKAHTLRSKGMRLRDIAAELKCGVATVSRDLEHVRESFQLFVLQDATEHAAALLDDINYVKSEARDAWERSKQVATETNSSRRTIGGRAFDSAGVKRKQRDGNPAYLREILVAVKLQGVLTGVLDKESLKDKGDAKPLCKTVAGIDPVELV